MTAGELCDSVETWYAKKINGRNNARILHDVAKTFDLCIPTCIDCNSYDQTLMAACTTETIHNDMFVQKNGMVTVLNKCTDTSRYLHWQ